MDDIKFNV